MWKSWVKKWWKALAGIAMGVGAYAWYRAMYDRSVGSTDKRLRDNRARADGIRDDNKQARDGIAGAKQGIVTVGDILARSEGSVERSREHTESIRADTDRAMEILRSIRERNARNNPDSKKKGGT